MSEEKNRTFQALQAMAILMVVDLHTGGRVGVLTTVFPYDSYFMPLFVMISGYFSKDREPLQEVVHKGRHLMLPYLAWCLVSDVVALVLQSAGLTTWYVSPTASRVASALLLYPLCDLNGPAWFVPMLFEVSAAHAFLRAAVGRIGEQQEKMRDYVLVAILVPLALGALIVSRSGWGTSVLRIVLLRLMFYLLFYHVGRCFARHWETVVTHWQTIAVCASCVLVNTGMCLVFGNEAMVFPGTSHMSHFSSATLPLVTSITGSLFWYEIARWLSEWLPSWQVIDFISGNTATIMETHLFFANIPNFVVLALARWADAAPPGGFDLDAVVASPWYTYRGVNTILDFVCGICGSLLVAFVLRRIRPCVVTGGLKASK